MIICRRNYQGDTFYLGHRNRKYYIRFCGMFQIAIYGVILSFQKSKITHYLHWSNSRIFYWVVPHYTGATHSVGLWILEITLVFKLKKLKARNG